MTINLVAGVLGLVACVFQAVTFAYTKNPWALAFSICMVILTALHFVIHFHG